MLLARCIRVCATVQPCVPRRFLALYAASLPAETAARVWDALFHEGPKVLLLVVLLAARPRAVGVLWFIHGRLRRARRCCSESRWRCSWRRSARCWHVTTRVRDCVVLLLLAGGGDVMLLRVHRMCICGAA